MYTIAKRYTQVFAEYDKRLLIDGETGSSCKGLNQVGALETDERFAFSP
ncbi:hypothetical protein [Stieleria sp. JC731]|nr:hypothetical protein [Stieleria sp. JC731]